MKEQDLIDLGFKKYIETPENGGFHYYTLGELISNANDEANESSWEVTLYGEMYDYVFTDTRDLRTLIMLLGKTKK